MEKINEFIEYIERLNKALDSVAYGGQFVPATLSPRVGVIVGPNARMVTKHLHNSGTIEKFYEIKNRSARGKLFAVQFKD
jgi:hypothetical protein